MCAPSGRSAGGSVIIVRASARDCSSRAVVAVIGIDCQRSASAGENAVIGS